MVTAPSATHHSVTLAQIPPDGSRKRKREIGEDTLASAAKSSKLKENGHLDEALPVKANAELAGILEEFRAEAPKNLFDYAEIANHKLFEMEGDDADIFDGLPKGNPIRVFVVDHTALLAGECMRLAEKYQKITRMFSRFFDDFLRQIKAPSLPGEMTFFCDGISYFLFSKKIISKKILGEKTGPGLAHDLNRFRVLFEQCQPYSTNFRAGGRCFLAKQQAQSQMRDVRVITYPNLFGGKSLKIDKRTKTWDEEQLSLERFYFQYALFLGKNIEFLSGITAYFTKIIGALRSFPGPYPHLQGKSSMTEEEIIAKQRQTVELANAAMPGRPPTPPTPPAENIDDMDGKNERD